MSDYYPDPDQMDEANEPAPDDEQKESQDAEYETFLAPKSAFSGTPEPGMKETIEIVHVYDDEVECRCTGGSDEEKPKSAMDESMDSMDAMASDEGA